MSRFIPRMCDFPVALIAAAAIGIAACSDITGPGNDKTVEGSTKTYYIAADEIEWDYAPAGKNLISNAPFDEIANVFVQRGPGRIGHVYRKALYREYTDASFSTLKTIPPEWRHLGTLGPLVRASVGDTIKIVFKNRASLPYSMHPHGVFYKKDSEGAGYDDGTSGDDKADDVVMPGATHTYLWLVPERAGPGPNDGSSVMWMYHSHVDETRDTYAGLIGPMIITAAGKASASGRPVDVDREFVVMYLVNNENMSWYIDDNIEHYADDPEDIDPEDGDFWESNLMHSINGYVYGNMPLDQMTMQNGERVRWYVMAMGTEVDLHTAHWHGQSLLWMGMRTDVIELMPASMKVLDMKPDNPGTWLFHCHVNDHLDAGMITRFRVLP